MSISVGLNCPACGGAISISEGENVLNCNYCGSLLWAEGDAGVMTVAFRNVQGRDSVLRLHDLPRYCPRGFQFAGTG